MGRIRGKIGLVPEKIMLVGLNTRLARLVNSSRNFFEIVVLDETTCALIVSKDIVSEGYCSDRASPEDGDSVCKRSQAFPV